MERFKISCEKIDAKKYTVAKYKVSCKTLTGKIKCIFEHFLFEGFKLFKIIKLC